MNLLSVNCRGCGRLEAVQELRHVVEERRPAVVFLMETRMGEERALGLKRDLGFSNAIVIKSEGLSGGLLLLWRQDVTVEELSKSRSHIDVLLSCDRLKITQWRLTGFYGEPHRERRKESWYLMRFLRAQSASPWLCLGDFNEVLLVEEQIGNNEREAWQMAAF
jgi:exonuclease III